MRTDTWIKAIAVALLPLAGIAAPAPAGIFQWEYINPADPSQGKRQNATLAPDGAGVDPTGAFTIASSYRWGLSNLYTADEVTLIAVPEPISLFLVMMSAVGWVCRRHLNADDGASKQGVRNKNRKPKPLTLTQPGRARRLSRSLPGPGSA